MHQQSGNVDLSIDDLSLRNVSNYRITFYVYAIWGLTSAA